MATTFTSENPGFVDFPTWLGAQLNEAISTGDQHRFAKIFGIIESRNAENTSVQIGELINGSYTVANSTAASSIEFIELMDEWVVFFNVTIEETA